MNYNIYDQNIDIEQLEAAAKKLSCWEKDDLYLYWDEETGRVDILETDGKDQEFVEEIDDSTFPIKYIWLGYYTSEEFVHFTPINPQDLIDACIDLKIEKLQEGIEERSNLIYFLKGYRQACKNIKGKRVSMRHHFDQQMTVSPADELVEINCAIDFWSERLKVFMRDLHILTCHQYHHCEAEEEEA